MAENCSLDIPKACNNEVIKNLKKFLEENSRLVELHGLNDKLLKNPDGLLLYFESRRVTGGGEVEKFYVSHENKAALLLFKEDRAAKRVVKEQYFLIEDSIITAMPPSPHLWNFEETAVHLVDCKFNGVPGLEPGLQVVKGTLMTLFESGSYNDSSVSVSSVMIDESKMETFVDFTHFLDALLVVEKHGCKDIKFNDVTIGKLVGLVEPPKDMPEQQADSTVIKKKTDIQFPVDKIRDLINELGLEVVVEKRKTTLRFTSRDPVTIDKLLGAMNQKNEENQDKATVMASQNTEDTKVTALGDAPKPVTECFIMLDKASVAPGQVPALSKLLGHANLKVNIMETNQKYIFIGPDSLRLKQIVQNWKGQKAVASGTSLQERRANSCGGSPGNLGDLAGPQNLSKNQTHTLTTLSGSEKKKKSTAVEKQTCPSPGFQEKGTKSVDAQSKQEPVASTSQEKAHSISWIIKKKKVPTATLR